MLTLIIVSWVLSGSASFVYWWTTEFDLTVSDILGSLAIGFLMGPFAYVAGWLIHGKPSGNSKPFVVMKKIK